MTPADLAAIVERLDGIEHVLYRILKRLDEINPLLARMTLADAAKQMGIGVRAATQLCARCVFSDARDRQHRRPGSKRMLYSDEVQLYILEGEAAVRRFRRQHGRL